MKIFKRMMAFNDKNMKISVFNRDFKVYFNNYF